MSEQLQEHQIQLLHHAAGIVALLQNPEPGIAMWQVMLEGHIRAIIDIYTENNKEDK